MSRIPVPPHPNAGADPCVRSETSVSDSAQPSYTADARAALARAGFSRRRFLEGAGVLIVGFSASGLANRLGVAADRPGVADGVTSVKGDGPRKVPQGELVGGRKFNVPRDATAARKPAREWTVLGTSVPRVDMPAMVTGQLEFVHTVRVPG